MNKSGTVALTGQTPAGQYDHFKVTALLTSGRQGVAQLDVSYASEAGGGRLLFDVAEGDELSAPRDTEYYIVNEGDETATLTMEFFSANNTQLTSDSVTLSPKCLAVRKASVILGG